VRVIERQGPRTDGHFTEGEPDLEPPEESAVLELDAETELEEDLDSRADLEEEVDEEVLESSLEYLVHEDDGDDDEGDVVAESVPPVTDDLEIDELEDREESLDRILREKLAGDEEGGDELHELEIDSVATAGEVKLSACGSDEFVCQGCFLVRNRTQLSPASGSLCRDCGE